MTYKKPPFETRAMRRAAQADSRKALRRLMNATEFSQTVANEDKAPLPMEAGKLPWSVEMSAGSLNWNATPSQTLELAEQAARELWQIGGAPRQAAREAIHFVFRSDLQMNTRYASLVTRMASWLAVTSEAGELVKSGAFAHCGYRILPAQRPGETAIFRFIGGFEPPIASNDNHKEDAE